MGIKAEMLHHPQMSDHWTVVNKKSPRRERLEHVNPSSKLAAAQYDVLEAPPGMEKESRDQKISTEVFDRSCSDADTSQKDSKRSSETSSKVLVSYGSMRSSRDFTTTTESSASSNPGHNRQTYSRQSSRSRMYPGPQPCSRVEDLRHCIKAASSGTGEIRHILENCTFSPREAAFTKFISECGSDLPKACELWRLLRSRQDLRPNTISYSALINVCAKARDWMEAEKVFTAQLQEAANNSDCTPNHISYSNLISACLKANQIERALYWHSHMIGAGLEGDGFLHSILLVACVEAGKSMQSVLHIMDQMHAVGYAAPCAVYTQVLDRLAREGTCTWNEAVEIFICANIAGALPDVHMCQALLVILDQEGAAQPAIQLLEDVLAAGMEKDSIIDLVTHVLQICSRLGKGELAMRLWEDVLEPHNITSADIARLVLESIENDTMMRGVSTPRMANLRSFSALPI